MFKFILIILNTYLLYKRSFFFWSPLQYSNTGIFLQNLLHIFTTDVFPFMFHIYVSTHWKSNVSRDETLALNVSFLVSMFHFLFTTPLSKNLSGRKIKPQWERFKTSVGEKSNPNGRNTTETLKSKMKHRMPMFHLLKVLIINALCYENETWNKKTSQGKYYVRARKERNLPRVTYPLQCAMRPRVGIANLGPDVPSWQYLMYWYSCIC